jgi:hypothetical protein
VELRWSALAIGFTTAALARLAQTENSFASKDSSEEVGAFGDFWPLNSREGAFGGF